MSLDKIGLHVIEGFSGPLCGPTGNPPRLVKLVDPSVAYVLQVRNEVGPRCLIIVRWHEAEQALDDPLASAEWWASRHLAEMDTMRRCGPIAFEGYNEIPDHQAAAYCEFEEERLRILHGFDLRSVVGNFSVGTPDLPVWATYRPMLDAMRDGDWLGLHEYWANRDGLHNPWHTGRWSMVPELMNRQVPIVVTECGRDRVEQAGAAGWRKTCGAEEYLDDLRQYNALLMQHDNVLGACVFTGGRIYDQWRDFEVNSIWRHVVNEYSQVSPKPGPNPGPEPKPTGPMLPIPGARISQGFGANPGYYAKYGYRGHNGVDLAAPDSRDYLAFHGTPVLAVEDGRAAVVYDADGYGLYVYIYSANCDWLYAHLSEVLVSSGEQIKAGQIIGRVGYTGNTEPVGARGTHLHWGKRPKPYQLSNGYRGYVDPLK